MSKHFVLLDFMHMRDNYVSLVPMPLATMLTGENLEQGKLLCQRLLEPMVEQFGIASVSAGFTPQPIVERNGWLWPQPHRWTEELGAAADLAFYSWTNRDWAPIHLCEKLDKDQRHKYDRLITYSGSEFICITYREKKNRLALYENVRIPGEKYKFTAWGTYPGKRSRRLTLPLPRRPDWRAAPGEFQSYAGGPRPHHTRVGQYFNVLDFCRSEDALARGLPWVLPRFGPEEPQVRYCKMFAEMFDPLVEQIGRISVTKGLLSKTVGADDPAGALHRWIPEAANGEAQIEFLLPQGTDEDAVAEVLGARSEVILLEFEDHPSETSLCRLRTEQFEPCERAYWQAESETVTVPMERRENRRAT